jgi:Excalibur calcium-binding domain
MRHVLAFVAALGFLSGGSATAANGPSTVSAGDQQRQPPWTRNCTALNRKYPHGVGRRRARDKTSDTPVTTFRRSTALYSIAMRWNKRLDRDKDGIACEKK